jgi:drug/metabolite transporter (DMT)-like permease
LRLLPPVNRQSGNQTQRQELHPEGGKVRRRVIDRREREIPPESSIWFNLGLAAVGIAAGAAAAAVTVVDSAVAEAVLWTSSAFVLVAGISYFFVHREVNRGRRVKRSQVIEDVEET